MAGLAAAFLLISERYRIPAQDAFTATKAMMNHHDNNGGRIFDGLRFYLDGDVFASDEILGIKP